MGCCTFCSRLTGKSRGELEDYGLRRIHAAGPRDAFLKVRDRLHGRVLEIGCGTGVLFDDYPPQARVTAVDPDRDFLALAQRNARRASAAVSVVAGDAQHLAFPDHHFDAAVAQFVFCFVPDPRLGLAEVIRVVRPGGFLYFYEHVLSLNPLYAVFQTAIATVLTWATEGCHWNRDTATLIRALPITIESDQRLTLWTNLAPPLPVVRICATKSR